MSKSVLHTIEDRMAAFSKGQKRIAHYILDHYDQAVFMTASKLGKLTEVSESTVVRFAAELGYEAGEQELTMLTQLRGNQTDRALDNSTDIRLEEPLQVVPTHRAKGAEAERTILLQVLEKLEQAVLPQHDALVFPEQRHRLLLKDPAHRVVDIVKMVVKMLARHAAAPHDLRHGDPVQGFLGHQLLEYSADLPLGRIAGLVCPFFHIDLHGPADSSPLQSSITHFPEECIYAEWGQVSDF